MKLAFEIWAGRLMGKTEIPGKFLAWFEARKKYRLDHIHIQMARELGLNPKKFGGLGNSHQQPWKLPLPDFIEELYRRRFGVERPAKVVSLEEQVAKDLAKKHRRKAVRQRKKEPPS